MNDLTIKNCPLPFHFILQDSEFNNGLFFQKTLAIGLPPNRYDEIMQSIQFIKDIIKVLTI